MKCLEKEKKLKEDRSRLVMILSHQLRTPLNHIKIIFSEFFENSECLNNFQKQLLNTGWHAVLKIISLVDRLLQMIEMEKRNGFKRRKNMFK